MLWDKLFSKYPRTIWVKKNSDLLPGSWDVLSSLGCSLLLVGMYFFDVRKSFLLVGLYFACNLDVIEYYQILASHFITLHVIQICFI